MNQLYFSLTFIFLVVFMNFHVHAAEDPDLISTACKKAVANYQGEVKYEFCVASLEMNPKSKTYDSYGLGVVSYKHTLKKGNSIKSHVDKLLKDGNQSPYVMEHLAGCSRDYANVSEVIYEKRNYIALSGVTSCQERFDSVFTSPLTKEENELRQLVFISFTLTDMTIP
ncbi:hypothetical protein MKW94_003691 [Papaver nudicaule]|uniref:Pectinesterase inhibitor domain-containing protein n=1 Tax=Papaver nudicaule TaxID=74823 RepID=A0AA42B5G6_PAPNU|nr:hypothetical protein [Papaver nudicaule]